MLKLTLKPGEFIHIGENIKVIFSGGSIHNIHLLIDAPKELNIARSKALLKQSQEVPSYQKEPAISKEAHEKIVQILMQEKRRQRSGNNAK